MTNPWSSQLQLINNLLAEKDRLIREKDDLIASKDKLWREMHQIIRERDEEIERLREKNKSRDGSVADKHKGSISSSAEEISARVSNFKDYFGDSEESTGHLKRRRSAMHSLAGQEKKAKLVSPDDSSNPNQDELESQPERFSEDLSLASTAPPAHSINPRQVAFAPLIGMSEDDEYEFGILEKVATPVIDSVRTSISRIEKRRLQKHRSTYPTRDTTYCAWSWASGGNSSAHWTVNLPKKYACSSCFNARRVCLGWLGNMRWMILPLPPEVRNDESTYEDTDYYIYDGSELAQSLPDVWFQNTN